MTIVVVDEECAGEVVTVPLTPMTTWTTWGSIRGGCGHAHRSLEAAQACLDRDCRGARRQGGYSDREMRLLANAGEAVAYDTDRGPGRAVAELDRAKY